MKKEMLCDFSSSHKILLVLNCWINSNKYVFLVIFNYFISDNWNYHEIFLIFKSFCDRHSEENLTNYIMKTLEFYDIMNQLLIITTDNAKNNDKFHKHLQKMLKKILFKIINKKQFIIWYILFSLLWTNSFSV